MFYTLFRLRLWLTAGLLVGSGAIAGYVGRSDSAPTLVPNPPAATPPIVAAPVTPPAEEQNPSVTPGLVHWHPSFAAAQEAAQCSGKPVLLFHMLGRLDKQFC
jgi:hypothetical protein